jgi:uncharacterized phiE125 gp8 family phage protein
MNLTRITPPAVVAVSLAEAKLHCRVDHADEDTLIASYIQAALQSLDGAEGALGRCLTNQTWKLTLEGFPDCLELPLPPCQSITSIEYVNTSGSTQTLSQSAYKVSGLGCVGGASILPAYGTSWPSTRRQPDAVSVTFVAGYGANSSNVPEPIRAAILTRVCGLYEGRSSLSDLSDTSDLINYKVWAF